jgi:hypothetical protein
MNCEQTRENLVLHREDSMLKRTKRREFLQHLRGCNSCQVEYEGLWHTATVLGSLEAPEPPPELLGNIQRQIRKIHKQSQTAFFASPISWLFGKLKLEFSPKFVNCAALLCYLLASVFLVKLAFFSDAPKQDFGLTAMQEARLRNVRISPSPWASLKHGNAKVDKALSTEMLRESHVNSTSPFAGVDAIEMWQTRAINSATETVDVRFSDTASKKLTLFWNDIKTNL